MHSPPVDWSNVVAEGLSGGDSIPARVANDEKLMALAEDGGLASSFV